jgi:hypothetical protein
MEQALDVKAGEAEERSEQAQLAAVDHQGALP